MYTVLSFKFGRNLFKGLFLQKKLYENELLKFNTKYFQTPMGQLHANVINITSTIYCFITHVR